MFKASTVMAKKPYSREMRKEYGRIAGPEAWREAKRMLVVLRAGG